MARVLTIAVVGVSDETTAHLRLLIRQAAGKLTQRWRWGTEIEADLIVVDTANFTGQMGKTRATAGGIRCAVVSDVEHHQDPEMLVLHRPLRIANVIDVLNRAAEDEVATGEVKHQGADFYEGDEEPAAAGAAFDDGPRPAPRPREKAAVGLDELIRGDPLAEPPPEESRRLLPRDATIAAGGGTSARGEARFNDTPASLRRSDPRMEVSGYAPRTPGMDAPMSAPPAGTPRKDLPGAPAKLSDSGSNRSIDSFLLGDSLGGPSQTRIAGAPALSLDPKNRVFHAAGSLSGLQAYCTTALSPGAWRPLTNAELNALREREPARPYEHLAWLGALLRSNGRLRPHLDPGGTYRLKQHVTVEHEFHAHGPIAHALLRPSRLHEIAQNSTATMDQVFDIVNAYDAVGYLEWTPRPSRYAKDDDKGGLFSKLKSRFTR
jgi:hypothetical protein